MAAVRILHLHSSFNLGGQESRTVRLINHFGDQAEHTILSAVPDAFGAADAIDKRIKFTLPKDAAPSLAGMPGPLSLTHNRHWPAVQETVTRSAPPAGV